MRPVDLLRKVVESSSEPRSVVTESSDLSGAFGALEKGSVEEYEKAERNLYARWEKFLGDVDKRAREFGFRVDSGNSSIRVDVHTNDPSVISGFVGFMGTKESKLGFIDKKDPAVVKAVEALSKGIGLPVTYISKMKNIPVFAFGEES